MWEVSMIGMFIIKTGGRVDVDKSYLYDHLIILNRVYNCIYWTIWYCYIIYFYFRNIWGVKKKSS